MQISDYFHGTWEGNVYSIMTRGFELGHWGHGSNRGRGTYIAQNLESAANWTWGSGVIIRCRLQPGTHILWMDGNYDQRVINSLRREFGNELLELGPQFHKAIPHNKQLTRQELIHLTNYILMHPRRMGGWGAFKGKRRATSAPGWNSPACTNRSNAMVTTPWATAPSNIGIPTRS